ncbi:MAG: flagellar basal-body MS-ring/collar protein FliF [Pseudomonadota bacterium]
MATLPVPAPTEVRDLTSPALALPGADFLRGAMRLPLARQVILLVAICASVAVGAASVLWMRSDDYKQLVTLNNAALATDVIAALDTAGIDYRLDDRAGLLVRSADFYRAKLQVSGIEGVSASPLGYEILDRDQGFGQSQMMEAVQHRRGLEGELARQIQAISLVQQARVLIAQPPRSAFLRNQRKPSASVQLTVQPGRMLEKNQIRAIASLVAGAVPELRPEDVSVVDQAARLLSAEADGDELAQSLKELDYVERLEGKLKRNVYNLLVPSLGPTGFSTEVVAEVDFTQAEEAAELYQPEVTSVRSETSLEEEQVGEPVLPVGVPGALANEPANNAPAGEEEVETEPVRRKSQVTRNYEVDRTVRYTRRPQAELQRLSVSVLIQDRAPLPPAEEGGDPVPNSWSAEELERFRDLVRGAIGFNEARGDQVTIISQPFLAIPGTEQPSTAFWEQPWFGSLFRQVFGGLVLVLLMIGLLRPLVRNVSQAGAVLKEQQALALARMAQEQEEQEQARRAAALEAEAQANNGGVPVGLLPEGSEVANQLDSVRELVNDDPERAAQVVKHWVGRDE